MNVLPQGLNTVSDVRQHNVCSQVHQCRETSKSFTALELNFCRRNEESSDVLLGHFKDGLMMELVWIKDVFLSQSYSTQSPAILWRGILSLDEILSFFEMLFGVNRGKDYFTPFALAPYSAVANSSFSSLSKCTSCYEWDRIVNNIQEIAVS